jgi:hypothetical protein
MLSKRDLAIALIFIATGMMAFEGQQRAEITPAQGAQSNTSRDAESVCVAADEYKKYLTLRMTLMAFAIPVPEAPDEESRLLSAVASCPTP